MANTHLLRKSIRDSARASFSRSGGPGGQNVNKLNTKVTLKVRLADLAGLGEAELERVAFVLANRISGEGELVITASEERSRQVNLEKAFARLEFLIGGAARLPKIRRARRPSKAAKEKRLRSKKLNSEKKANRRKTD